MTEGFEAAKLRPFYFFLFFVFCFLFFSYSQIDLNLTLSSWSLYQLVQTRLIDLGYFHRFLAAWFYGLIIIGLFISYWLVLLKYKQNRQRNGQAGRFVLLKTFLAAGGILVFAYPAFSHDIFNYIFNAKMLLKYGADPHVKIALDYSFDPWTRFMHNVHTPAPYGRGWTYLSLLPAFLGVGKLVLNLFWFKILELIFYFGCLFLLWKLFCLLELDSRLYRLVFFALNPLVLLETVGVGHNDLVMMFLALLAVFFLFYSRRGRSLFVSSSALFIFSLGLLGLSALIKYATLVLAILFFIYYFWGDGFDFAFWASVFLFTLPFVRPYQMHSWYFVWGLSFLVMSKDIGLLKITALISFFLLLIYVLFVYYGHWDFGVHRMRWFVWGLNVFVLLGHRLGIFGRRELLVLP